MMRLATYRAVRLQNLSVRLMQDVLTENGLDPMPAFREAGIQPSIVHVAGGTLTGPQELAFQRAFARLTEERPELWVELGFRYRLTTFRANGFAMLTAPTLQHWARAAAESSDLIYSMTEITAVDRGGTITELTLDYSRTPADLVEFSVHRDVAAVLVAQNELWGGEFPNISIGVPLPELHVQLTALMRAPVKFGDAVLRFEWTSESATRRLPHGDDLQYETFLVESRRLARRFRLDHDVTATVMAALTTAPMAPDLSTLAARLSVSERTLQRRLRDTNLTFRELRDRARSEIARDALSSSNVSIATLARRLGYSEPTAFTAAFRRWTGCSPSQFRSDPSSLAENRLGKAGEDHGGGGAGSTEGEIPIGMSLVTGATPPRRE
jgi:AraC-like DNA-binding protein